MQGMRIYVFALMLCWRQSEWSIILYRAANRRAAATAKILLLSTISSRSRILFLFFSRFAPFLLFPYPQLLRKFVKFWISCTFYLQKYTKSQEEPIKIDTLKEKCRRKGVESWRNPELIAVEAIMRTLCDVCESAAAIIFCAADEAALCRACDEKVHTCNKLANKHVRVGLADPTDVPRCDICENAPAFFYCEIDGSSLCLQCDMIVHVGGKRTHERYLLLRQRVEFPGDKPGPWEELGLQPLGQNELKKNQSQPLKLITRDGHQNHRVSTASILENNVDDHGKMDKKLIDLNTRPQRLNGPTSNNQELAMDISSGNNDESVVPIESFKCEAVKK